MLYTKKIYPQRNHFKQPKIFGNRAKVANSYNKGKKKISTMETKRPNDMNEAISDPL